MFKDKKMSKMHYTKIYVYALFDKITGGTRFYQVAENDSRAILNLLSMQLGVPFVDCQLLRLGELETSIPPVEPDDVDVRLNANDVLSFDFYKNPVVVSWKACKLPESEAEALAPLGLSASETAELVRRQQSKLNLETSKRS